MQIISRTGLTIQCILLASALAIPAHTQSRSPQRQQQAVRAVADHVPGEILLRFRGNPQAAEVSAAARVFGAKQVGHFKMSGVRHWRLGKGMTVERALAVLARMPEAVEFAEPNYLFHATQTELPNDAMRNELWGMHNLGQTGGTSGAHISALTAWAKRTDASAIIVAVIDSGVDYNHPDLAANITRELNGTVIGYDFVNDDADPMDDNGHGTHVAGTIGAVGGNGFGVVGVCWNVKIMPLKFLNSGGSGSTANAIKCIEYASAHGARISNNSWGGGRKSKALERAIQNSDMLFVVAAGNAGSSNVQYPAAYASDKILSVAATNHKDLLANFSSYGADWVDLAAPGVKILSTYRNAGYTSMNGTSMASPHVAGIAALVLAGNTSMSVAALKSQMMVSVDTLASLSGKCVTGGRINAAKAVGATAPPADETPPADITNLAAGMATDMSVPVTWTATGDDLLVGTAYLYDLRYSTSSEFDFAFATTASGEGLPFSSTSPENFTVTDLTPGRTYYFRLRVVDEAGNEAISNEISATTLSPQPGSWVLETVDSGKSYSFTSMALNGTKPIVAYRLSEGGERRATIASFDGTAWIVESVPETTTDNGRWINVAHKGMTTHVIYFDDVERQLRYGSKTGTTWSLSSVDSGESKLNGNWSKLVVDATGMPHMSYRFGFDGQMGGVKYAHLTAGGWVNSIVKTGKGAGAYGTSLALDSSGKPYVSFHDEIDRKTWGLRFASQNGVSWNIIDLESQSKKHLGDYTSLAIHTDGTRHICYGDAGSEELHYARWDETNGWVKSIVDTDPRSGDHCVIALDAQGNPHIAYSSDALRELRHATWDVSNGWVVTTIDDNGGLWPGIAVDTTGGVHISYTNFDEMKYAHKLPQ